MDVKCGVFYFPEHSKVLIALGKFKVNRPIYYYFISANSHALFPICIITYVKIGRNKYLRKNSNVCIYEPWCLLLIATYLTQIQKFKNELHNSGKSNYLFILVLPSQLLFHIACMIYFIYASNTKCIFKNQTRWNTITKFKGVSFLFIFCLDI